MIDIKLIREDADEVVKLLNLRGKDFSYIYEIRDLDTKRREIIKEVENLKAKKNSESKLIGQYKREKKDTTEIIKNIGEYSGKIKEYDDELLTIEQKVNDMLLSTPNMPKEDIPVGLDENDNVEIKKVGEPKKFNYEPKNHWDLGTDLDILDFERAAKITGSRFVVYKGLGAKLERALKMFMLDLHTMENGYTEILPPFIVNRESMTATGQLPKFEEDAFSLKQNPDYFLNPTAEVPTINLHRNEILDGKTLPISYTSFTTAFRAEAGSAGKDTRGILRQHQFNKVELIKFTTKEDSYLELEKMLKDSEKVLQLLDLPYRVVNLCSGDLGFSMRKTYDIEVWIPGQNRYREIGSISNAEDYQARRANIRYRDSEGQLQFVHTLNGSGLAIGRTIIALMENYQNEDGTIDIPKVLQPYMNVKKIGE